MHDVETMAYAGQVPWHGLGVEVDSDLSPEEMLKAADLDWEVEKRDMFFSDKEGEEILMPKKALVRTTDDSLLDIVGEDWNHLQNRDAFDFFKSFVDTGDMEMHTAGSLSGGQRVWALAKVKDAFEVFKGDVVENYLLFSNPHKYGHCIDVRMTPIRVVCNNTLTFALEQTNAAMAKINHSTEFDAEMVMKMLDVADSKMAQYKEAAKFLGSKTASKDNVIDFFKHVFPTNSERLEESRNAAKAREVLETQPGSEYGEGTWWQAFNAVTYLLDHKVGRKADTRLNSAWYGLGKTTKERAMKSALEYAKAA